MKKKPNDRPLARTDKNLILLKMKLTLILSFAFFLSSWGESLSQTVKLSIDLRNAPVERVIQLIEDQTDFYFLYQDDVFRRGQKVTISVKDTAVEDILQELASQASVDYRIIDYQVVIVSKESEASADAANSAFGAQQPQRRVVAGTVRDQKGLALPGVSILVKGTTTGTITGSDGAFSLEVPADVKVLVFSFVGMLSQEIDITGQTTVSVTMIEETLGIEEVVAVGYGRNTRRNLTSSVSSVKPEDLNRGAISDVGQLLQGKVPGLNISASGDPNKRAAIVLRGASTINSPGGPFFVIDGVPGADISLVAPEDIASVDVLKDAAATAIYGNRAAAGVIMITTKKGRKGQTQVTYNGYVGIEKVSSFLDMMDAEQHRAYIKSQGLAYNPIDDKGANTNWQEAVMRDQAISHNQNVSFSGGGEDGTYSASINYLNREGIMVRSNQERYIARLNIEQQFLNDKVKVNLNVTNSKTNSKLVPLQNTVLEQMASHLPVSPVFNPDGTWFENFNIPGYFNPVGLIDNAQDDNTTDRLMGSLNADITLPFNLTYSLQLSYQNAVSKSSQFYGSYYGKYSPSNFYNNPDPGFGGASLIGTLFGVNGSAYRSAYENNQRNLETYLNWTREFGAHDIVAVLGFSWINARTNDGINSSSTNFPSDFFGYNNFSLGNPYAITNFRISLAGGYEDKRLISDFARVNYNYDDRFLIQGSIRRDGSSVFGENYRWGYFPSVGAAWRISNESFMENQSWFDDLKLRASYGVTGNAEGIGAFNAKIVYGITGTYYNNGVMDNAYGPLQGANPDLRWEKTATTNFGLDFSILGGLFNGTIDVYEKNTSDMLFQYNVSPSLVPGGRIWANGGSINNKGVEVSLNSTPVKSNDFSWTTSVNLATNKNEITSLTNPYSTGDSIRYVGPRGQGQTGASLQILKVGKPLGQFFSFIYEGKNSEGLSQFRKQDGTLTTAPINGNDYFYIGDAQPRLLAGWSNTLKYKRFDLNFFFRGVFGNKIFNVSRGNLSYTPNATTSNLSKYVDEKDLVTDARNSYYSTRYLESGTYIRLDNATLGYEVNTKMLGINNLRLYVTGQNLLTFTRYKGIDPEINQGGVAPGVDSNNFYPKTRVFMFGLNVTF